jgi:tetratricopeptide (TPR) repeat protein
VSLLLEALKKAEKAKEEAQKRERGSTAAAPPAEELRLQDDPRPAPKAPAAEARPVLTRAELPDISQPLEILSDDIATPKPAPTAPSSASPRPNAAPAQKAPAPDADSAGRASARKVFEAKFKEPNPRLPFYITMGALGIFAVCTVGYFWYQLRPAPSLVNSSPRPAAAENPVAAAPAPERSQTVAASGTPGGSQAIPGLPSTPASAPQPAASISQAPVAAPRGPSPTPAVPRPSPVAPAELVARSTAARAPQQQVARAPEPAPQPSPTIASSRPTPEINPRVASGYAAYTSGDFARARSEYEEALREEPANRDALLGLAAVEVRSGLFESAEATYLRLLRADPRDASAQAGLIALRGTRMNPQLVESRVKTLLATDPQAHVLHFTLGNQFAQQGRWPEAQQEYFTAFAAEPENPDFAYNLAVSLDHMRQPKLAREYYQRAIALAATRGASFDAVSARARTAQLGN